MTFILAAIESGHHLLEESVQQMFTKCKLFARAAARPWTFCSSARSRDSSPHAAGNTGEPTSHKEGCLPLSIGPNVSPFSFPLSQYNPHIIYPYITPIVDSISPNISPYRPHCVLLLDGFGVLQSELWLIGSFLKIRGTFLGPHDKDYSILGVYIRVPRFASGTLSMAQLVWGLGWETKSAQARAILRMPAQ